MAVGPVIGVPDGYLDFPSYPARDLKTEQDVADLFTDFEGISNIVGVKTSVEYGFGPFDVLPVHSQEVRDLVRKQSEKNDRPIYIHALDEREQLMALDMGAHALVHSGFQEGPPSEEVIQRMKQQGTYLHSTLGGTMELLLTQYYPERLDDPLIQLTVPEEELVTGRDPKAWQGIGKAMLKQSVPSWVPDFVLDLFSGVLVSESQINKLVKNSSEGILALHQAGIPIVVGSDAGNWEEFPNIYHGSSTIREIELLGEAGLSALDVISSATRIPAEMIGIENLVGTVEVGKKADLIVVHDDPLENLEALRNLQWVIKGGEVRTPKGWMQD